MMADNTYDPPDIAVAACLPGRFFDDFESSLAKNVRQPSECIGHVESLRKPLLSTLIFLSPLFSMLMRHVPWPSISSRVTGLTEPCGISFTFIRPPRLISD